MSRRFGLMMMWILFLVLGASELACDRHDTSKMTEWQKVSSGNLDIVLLSPSDAVHHGKDMFTIEFRATSDAHLVDVGDVRATATMPMAGSSPMFGSVDISRTNVPGRYAASSDFGMAGTWRMQMQWDGPAGKGTVAFSGSVQ